MKATRYFFRIGKKLKHLPEHQVADFTGLVQLGRSGCRCHRVQAILQPRLCLLPAALAARCPSWPALAAGLVAAARIDKVTLRTHVLPELITLQHELDQSEHQAVPSWPWQARLLVTLKPGTWNLKVFPCFCPSHGLWSGAWGSSGPPASPDLMCIRGTAEEKQKTHNSQWQST